MKILISLLKHILLQLGDGGGGGGPEGVGGSVIIMIPTQQEALFSSLLEIHFALDCTCDYQWYSKQTERKLEAFFYTNQYGGEGYISHLHYEVHAGHFSLYLFARDQRKMVADFQIRSCA